MKFEQILETEKRKLFLLDSDTMIWIVNLFSFPDINKQYRQDHFSGKGKPARYWGTKTDWVIEICGENNKKPREFIDHLIKLKILIPDSSEKCVIRGKLEERFILIEDYKVQVSEKIIETTAEYNSFWKIIYDVVLK